MMKRFGYLLSIGVLLVGFLGVVNKAPFQVLADDDEDEYEYEDYEDEGRSEDDYEDEEDDYEGYEYETGGQQGSQYQSTREGLFNSPVDAWNKWTRSSIQPATPVAPPLQETKDVSFKLSNGSTASMVAVPFKGQIFVPIKTAAEFLGATAHFYEKEHAVEVVKGEKQFIVKLGSKAIYENMKKTPMPLPIMEFEQEMYIPLSVLIGVLGYSADWTGDSIMLNGGM